jgi:hypothetical protein
MFLLKSAGNGDYQSLLIGGMSEHLARRKGMIQLERVGPFIPPLSVAGSAVVVTEAMRSSLAGSDFKDWSVKPVLKAHIVRWEWTQLTEADNLRGEPEDMILSRPHDPEVSQSLGELYELVLPIGCHIVEFETNPSITTYELQCKKNPEGDLFRAKFPGTTLPMCSSNFREWIETLDEVRPWIKFVSAIIKCPGIA